MHQCPLRDEEELSISDSDSRYRCKINHANEDHAETKWVLGFFCETGSEFRGWWRGTQETKHYSCRGRCYEQAGGTVPAVTCRLSHVEVWLYVFVSVREREESRGGSACHNALILSDIYPMEATLIHPSITFHPFLPSFALRFMSFPHSLLVASDRQSNRARIPSTPPRTHALRNIALSMNCCIVAPKAQFK